MAKFNIRSYTPADKSQVFECIKSVYNEQCQKSFEFLWEWQHGQDLIRLDANHCSKVIENSAGQVVGYIGTIPVRFNIGGQPNDGAFLFNAFVAPTARGSGMHLYRHVVRNSNVLVGAGNSVSRGLFPKIVGRDDVDIKNMTIFVYIIDPASLLKSKGLPLQLANCSSFIFKVFTKLQRMWLKTPEMGNRTIEVINLFPEKISLFCQEFAHNFPNSMLRDHNYLNWRFVECPIHYHKLLLWNASDICGYIIFRPAILNKREILLLVEIAATGNQQENYRILLNQAHKFALHRGLSEIQTLDTGCPVFSREIRSQGYISKSALPAMGHIRMDKNKDCPIYQAEYWFLSGGDSDFEFSFFNQFETNLQTVWQ